MVSQCRRRIQYIFSCTLHVSLCKNDNVYILIWVSWRLPMWHRCCSMPLQIRMIAKTQNMTDKWITCLLMHAMVPCPMFSHPYELHGFCQKFPEPNTFFHTTLLQSCERRMTIIFHLFCRKHNTYSYIGILRNRLPNISLPFAKRWLYLPGSRTKPLRLEIQTEFYQNVMHAQYALPLS